VSLLPAVFHQIVDATGQPVSGGFLFAYAAGGGVVPQATYADEDLTVLNDHPVEADADGVLPPVFLTPEVAYRIVETDAALAQLREQDDVYAPVSSADQIVTRLRQIAASPLDYGAVGDGQADDRDAVQAALDASTGVVDLLGFTFRCDTALQWPAGVEIRNGTLDFAACADDACLEAHGAVDGTTFTLTSNGTIGDGTIALDSVAGLAAGDLLALRSGTAEWLPSTPRGEVVEVQGIAALVVSLQNALLDDYTTASASVCQKITTVDDVRLTNVTVLGAAGISGDTDLVSLRNTRRARITNCHLAGVDHAAVQIAGGYDTQIVGTTITDGAGCTAGVYVRDASQLTTLRSCVFSGLDLAVAADGSDSSVTATGGALGVTRFLDVLDCQFRYGGTAASPQLSATKDCQFVRVLRNVVSMFSTAAGDALAVDCVDCDISSNEIYRDGTGTPDGIQLAISVPLRTNRGFSVRCNDNKIRTDGVGVSYAGQAVVGGAGTLTLLEICGNQAFYTGSNNVVVEAGTAATAAPISALMIARNTLSGPIAVTAGHASVTIGTVNLWNNVCSTITITGTTFNITSARLRQNTASGTTAITQTTNVAAEGGSYAAITITDATTMQLKSVFALAAAAVTISNANQEFTRCLINGCTFLGSTGRSLQVTATDATGSQNLNISGCHLATNDPALPNVEVTGVLTGFVFSGNTCPRSGDSDGNLVVTGTAANNISFFTVTGCYFQNGDVAIDVTNNAAANTSHDNNVFNSVGANDSGAGNTAVPVEST
jgi:hypothetical protein